MACAVPLGVGTNIQAEIRAAIFGLTFELEMGYRKILLVIDSKVLVEWLAHKTNT